eukprot:scaffold96075_cov31-Tisochrysis_lutea.AAC.9
MRAVTQPAVQCDNNGGENLGWAPMHALEDEKTPICCGGDRFSRHPDRRSVIICLPAHEQISSTHISVAVDNVRLIPVRTPPSRSPIITSSMRTYQSNVLSDDAALAG